MDCDESLPIEDLDKRNTIKECTSLFAESENISLTLFNLKHQQRVMKEAIDTNGPPNDLIPAGHS